MTDNQKAAKNYLSNIQSIEKAIHNKTLELEALRYKASGAGGIDYSKEKIQTTPQNYLEMAIADIIEIEAELEEDKASIEEAKATAYSIIKQMKEPEQRAILEWFYLNAKPMTEVAQIMYMSERNAYYLLDDAHESFGYNLSS